MSRSRYRSRPPSSGGRGSVIASVVVMSALLVVMVTSQRSISTGISQMFTGVTETPDGSGVEPGPATVRLGIATPVLATQVAQMTVARAVQRASLAAQVQVTP